MTAVQSIGNRGHGSYLLPTRSKPQSRTVQTKENAPVQRTRARSERGLRFGIPIKQRHTSLTDFPSWVTKLGVFRWVGFRGFLDCGRKSFYQKIKFVSFGSVHFIFSCEFIKSLIAERFCLIQAARDTGTRICLEGSGFGLRPPPGLRLRGGGCIPSLIPGATC